MKTMNYESPQVEIIEVEVEQGFATSQSDAQSSDWVEGTWEGVEW